MEETSPSSGADGLRRVLIFNHMLTGFTGSEIHALQLADHFERSGAEVTLMGLARGEPFLSAARARGHRVVGLAGGTMALRRPHDVVWTHHQTGFVIAHLLARTRARRHLHGILSWQERLEFPPLRKTNPQGISLLANSPETRDVLQDGTGQPEMRVFGNPVPDEFFDYHAAPQSVLKRLAIVSNHPPPEMVEAVKILERQGLMVTHFGRLGEYREIGPETLIGYDAVVTIGKTVQYALAQGLPVFVYDHFGGPGWMPPSDLALHEHYNFSGRSDPQHQPAATLANMLTEGYSAARSAAPALRSLADQRYRLSAQITDALDGATTAPAPALTRAEWISEALAVLRQHPQILVKIIAPQTAQRIQVLLGRLWGGNRHRT